MTPLLGEEGLGVVGLEFIMPANHPRPPLERRGAGVSERYYLHSGITVTEG